MKSLSINENITIVNADCLEYMRTMPENSVDAIVTDPPAGISFMGKEWDTYDSDMFGKKGEEGKNDLKVKKNFEILPRYGNADLIGFQNFIYQSFTEAIRVLKPGGHALVWAIPRTSHHTAMGLERAGFEIRDVVSHIFGSGFPKSLNIGKAVDKMLGNERKVVGELKLTGTARNKETRGAKTTGALDHEYSIDRVKTDITKGKSEFEGLGTALKPAIEFWCLARKPLSEPTIAQNCIRWGTGGLSIDECRVGIEKEDYNTMIKKAESFVKASKKDYKSSSYNIQYEVNPQERINHQGRFPANLILTCICDEVKEGEEFVSGSFPEKRGETAFFGLNKKHSHRVGQVKDKAIIHTNPNCPCYLLDRQSGKTGAFAPVKSGQKGFGGEIYGKYKTGGDNGATFYGDGLGGASRFFYQAKASRSERGEDNKHPTVKPIKLMEYLIKLVSREGQIVLDPFLGSGSTLIACENLNRKGIGIEKDKGYFEIATARLKNLPNKLFN